MTAPLSTGRRVKGKKLYGPARLCLNVTRLVTNKLVGFRKDKEREWRGKENQRRETGVVISSIEVANNAP